jgi:putative acetyltransferase
VRTLFRAYAECTDAPVCFEGFDAEVAGLPGEYARPRRRLLLAADAQGRALGCVALRRLAADAVEMCRLFVRPEARGRGLGRALAQAAIAAARQAGYRQLRLSTLPSMTAAQALYRSLGLAELGRGAAGVDQRQLDLAAASPKLAAARQTGY